MTFKELIKQDARVTFLNHNEFADMHSINGCEVPVLIDQTQGVEKEQRFSQHMDGVYTAKTVIYVNSEDLDFTPERGQTITLDGKQCMIEETTDEYGVWAITLNATKAPSRTGIPGRLF